MSNGDDHGDDGCFPRVALEVDLMDFTHVAIKIEIETTETTRQGNSENAVVS